MLQEASLAVARLDPEALEALRRRAEAVLLSGAVLADSQEMTARHRVFAAIVKATGENLAVLEKARSGAGHALFQEAPWGR